LLGSLIWVTTPPAKCICSGSEMGPEWAQDPITLELDVVPGSGPIGSFFEHDGAVPW
jgi:hypothetical protein